MPKLLQKVIFSFLAVLLIFFSVAPNFALVKAADTPATGASWYNTGFGDWYQKVYDENTSPGNEIFGERYTAAQVQWVIYGVYSFVINAIFGNTIEGQQIVSCLLSGDVTSCIQSLVYKIDTSAPVAENNQPSLFSLVFANRPLSGISYFKEKIQSFSLVSAAYAQSPGYGFGALDPFQSMWKAARDIAFGLFVIAAIVLAFMIMFRVKISPQVVITIQSAIPKLLIALVLVTFSYAIAGFLVDLMYVVMGILSVFLSQFAVAGALTPNQAFNMLVGVGSKGVQGGLSGLFNIAITYMYRLIVALILLLFKTSSASGVLLGGTLTTLWWVITLIVGIVCIWIMLKAFWGLLKTFANVILLTVFAPIYIVLGVVIPELSFASWFKRLAAALSVFVVFGVIMQLSLTFLGYAWSKAGLPPDTKLLPGIGQIIWDNLFSPHTTVSPYWPPWLTWGNDADASIGLMFLGISFVLFTLLSKASDIVNGFMTGKPFSYGSAVGEAMGPVGTAYTGARGGTAYAVKEYERLSGTTSTAGSVLRTIGFIK